MTSHGVGGQVLFFKGPWPVPNKVTELPSLATVEDVYIPGIPQEEGRRTGWALSHGCLNSPSITHCPAQEHSIGSLFGRVSGPEGQQPPALSAYGNVPSGLQGSPILHSLLSF